MSRPSLLHVDDPPPPFDLVVSTSSNNGSHRIVQSVQPSSSSSSALSSSVPAGSSAIHQRKPSVPASVSTASATPSSQSYLLHHHHHHPHSHQHVSLNSSTAAMIAAASSTATAAALPEAAALSPAPAPPGGSNMNYTNNPSTSRPASHGMKIAPTKSLSAAIAEAAAKNPAGSDVIQASLLAPRVAVILNVPKSWHLPLFVGRLISILPAILYGWRPALQLLDQILPGDAGDSVVVFPRTETALASMWCFAAGYLSFFFADCLMSRWLINYTPQATIVRLLSINAVNFYMTNTTLKLFGAFHDLRLFLPAWIAISAVLTGAYHVTHQKINIRKETITSINVFSIASSISMVSLLLLAYGARADLPDIPLVVYSRLLFAQFLKLLVRLRASLREHHQQRQ
ncbi:N-glycosylation protein eos1 [Ceratocystis fimbriata CBS 114723]|uniref:N-glycosylation protein eos1 n=1 Tax=Ceratocystis fimbriata CBS 114723 TaxID=1035309 RepID=A0A2C5WR33_9PEZI|nr:N-glycosylation protein eos1 [Ceratocystis fimbriata CBS 114723]